MNFLVALLSVSKNIVAAETDDVDEEDGHVVVLTDSNFDDYINKNKYVLVEFYAPWCGHCKSLAPEYEKAATALKETPLQGGATVTLAKVDGTTEQALAKKFEVSGYPTLYWFVDGVKSDYDGGRTKDTIIDWISDIVTDAVKEVTTVPAPTKRCNVVLTGPTKTEAFDKLANTHRKTANYFFVKSSGESKVILQHPGEDELTTTSTDSLADLEKFIKENSFPLFGLLDGETYGKYVARENHGMVWLLFSSKDSEDHKEVVESSRSTGLAIGKALAGKFSVFHTDVHEFAKPLESMLGVTTFPTVVVHLKGGDKKKYIYSGDITTEAVTKFIDDIAAGKVKVELKSDPVPDNSANAVRVVVGSEMEKEIFRSDKDVLFEVYAPWCGHCKKLEPEYEKVAKKLQKEELDHVILSKMDGTTNDSPSDAITWGGFPTLFWIKAGTSTPVPYDGGRDAKGIWKFLKANATHKDSFAKKQEQESEKEEL